MSVSAARPGGTVLGAFSTRRGGRAAVVLGGGLILIGWAIPWGAAGADSVSGLSAVLAPWFRVLVVGSGLLAVVAGSLIGHRAARWGVGVSAAATVGWSLVFPAVVYVGARSLAGFGDAPATIGPSVTHGAGAYLLSPGVVAIALGCGPAVTAQRVVWIGTTIAALLSGVLLLVGLS